MGRHYDNADAREANDQALREQADTPSKVEKVLEEVVDVAETVHEAVHIFKGKKKSKK